MPSKTHVENIKRLQEIYDKLDNQSIVKEELDELVQVSASLHEKAVILRYKAAEERVFGDAKNMESTPKPEVQEPKAKIEPAREQEEIDFSIFEKKVPEVKQELPVEKEVAAVQQTDAKPSSSNDVDWAKYFDQVVKNQESGIQTSIASIAGSFGLNERILYTNELFDGEAEKFSDCVQKLDNIPDWTACVSKLVEIAKSENWEKSNEAIEDFILHLNRKYA